MATDSAQRVVWRWDSAPFGDTPALEDPDGDGVRFTLNLRFPGQYFDAETGLHYNYYRDYDPATGRYIESDPIGLRGGVNTYGYAHQNPVRAVDPTGEVVIALPVTPVGPLVLGGCAALGSFLGVTAYHLLSGATDCAGGVGSAAGNGCEEDDDCKKASKWQLRGASPEPIVNEEEFKKEWVGDAGGSFDICACKDGSLILRTVGKCGTERGGIPTDSRWK